MRKLVFGAIVGVVIGVVIGSTVIAPRLKLTTSKGKPGTELQRSEKQTTEAALATNSYLNREESRVRWRMASAYTSTIPQLGELGVRLERVIWRVSGGKLHLKLHEPGTLVPNNQIFDAVRSKTIQAAFGASTFWADRNSAFHLFSSIPFGPSIQEYLSWFYNGGGNEILESLYKRQGVYGVVCGAVTDEGSGWFRKPVKNIETFKELRIGMVGLGGMVARKVGAQVQEFSERQAFEALKRNKVDGAEVSQPAVDMNLGFHKLAKHYYFPSWHQPYTLIHLIMNIDSWHQLPANKKSQIKVACADNVTHGIALGGARQFDALKEFTKQGVHFQIWSPEIISALKNAWHEVRNELAKANPQFKETLKSLETFREKYAIWSEISIGKPQS